MRLATINSQVVGVHSAAGVDRYVNLHAIDRGDHGEIPRSLIDVLKHYRPGLQGLKVAMDQALAGGHFLSGKLQAPIPVPGKVFCIGLNYRDHAKETNATIPTEPIVFSKFSSAINAPDAPIILPRASQKVDYEAELVAVIGRRGKNIPAAEAGSYIAGYMNGNDVSARDWQLEKPGKQWLLGKTPDTFGPTGPYLVTADEIPDHRKLSIRLKLNGQTMQDSSTSELIFSVEQLIEHISKVVTLDPGDLIFTGTPPGVGVARKPPVFLKPGDRVEIEISGLGTLSNPVVAE